MSISSAPSLTPAMFVGAAGRVLDTGSGSSPVDSAVPVAVGTVGLAVAVAVHVAVAVAVLVLVELGEGVLVGVRV
jgi:hypothetical protein